MPLIAVLLCLIAALLALGVLAVPIVRMRSAAAVIYTAALAISILLSAAVLSLFAGGSVVISKLTLPVGLPWLGAHFRVDALAAFFPFVVNLRGAAASLYAIPVI
jgi:hydrogenase-4 component B